MTLQEYYTTAEVAEMMEVTGDTVRDWIQSGKLPAVKVNSRWKVSRSEIQRFSRERYGLSNSDR